MKKLIFIGIPQYGYQIDYYNYAKYLSSKYQITYICVDEFKPKIKNNRIEVIYLSGKSNKNKIIFTINCLNIINNNHPDLVIIYNYLGAFFLQQLSSLKKDNIILDIRSMCVSNNYYRRRIIDLLIRNQSKLFNNLTVVSEGIKKKHFSHHKNCSVIPVGAQSTKGVSQIFKNKNELNLIYVGTLNGRNISQTLEGIADFISKTKLEKVTYKIIGYGEDKLVDKIKKEIKEYGLGQVVNYLGYIENHKLNKHMINSDVGVSYIPKTEYFNYQPPTKTFEYLQFGLPVLATSTYENTKVINKRNGVLIEDTPESFSDGLLKIHKRRIQFDPNIIKKSSAKFKWKNVVKKLDKEVINKLIK